MRAQQLRPHLHEPAVELTCGLERSDRHPGAREHRSGVEARLDPHEVDTGLEITGEDRPLDGRRTAPTRQEREVHVHEAVWQCFEQRDREQLSERHHHAQHRLARTHVVDDFAGLLRRAQR